MRKESVCSEHQDKKNWPTNNLCDIEIGQSNFNDFYYLTDQHGTLLACWMDNGLIYCVSTIHKPEKMVKRSRKRPKKIKLNAKHVDTIFGTEGQMMNWIPKLIGDYNHKMGGVDLVDQCITYYQPNV